MRRPAGTAELAQQCGLHPNGVRVHLARLEQDGLVVQSRTSGERGRPRSLWSVSPSARPGGAPPTAYSELAIWLVRIAASARVSERTLERHGRQIGRELAPGPAGDPRRSMFAALTAMGFQPREKAEQPGALAYELCNCPYRDAVRDGSPSVCALHRGMTRGLLDVIAPRTRLAAFVPQDPDEAGCRIELRGALAAQGS